jgi:hypothetical protein
MNGHGIVGENEVWHDRKIRQCKASEFSLVGLSCLFSGRRLGTCLKTFGGRANFYDLGAIAGAG